MDQFDEAEEAIFNAARQCADLAERRRYLDRVCAENPEARRRIDRLLGLSSEADGFFQRNALALAKRAMAAQVKGAVPPALSETAGTRVGRYKLLEQIGEGGFGVVFMAEQEEPVRRKVALKIIKLGM